MLRVGVGGHLPGTPSLPQGPPGLALHSDQEAQGRLTGPRDPAHQESPADREGGDNGSSPHFWRESPSLQASPAVPGIVSNLLPSLPQPEGTLQRPSPHVPPLPITLHGSHLPWSREASWRPTRPCTAPLPPALASLTPLLTRSAPDTGSSWLFLQHVKHGPATGPLQVLFLLPLEPPPPDIHGAPCHLLQVSAQVSPVREAFPDRPAPVLSPRLHKLTWPHSASLTASLQSGGWAFVGWHQGLSVPAPRGASRAETKSDHGVQGPAFEIIRIE